MNTWQTETARIREITRQTAGLVAPAIGDGWTVDTDPRWDEYRVVYVDGPDGARLSIGLDWRNPDRVEIAGLYPDGARNVYPSAERHEIGVRRDRGPEVIAREVTRRLLPKYLAELERVTAGIVRHDDGREAMRAVARELAAMIPGASLPDHRQDETRARVWVPGGDVEIGWGGKSVRVEFRSLDVAVARAMLAAYVAAGGAS